MRLFVRSIVPLVLLPLVLAACSWVDPSECWVNTSGGFGGGGTIPIGAGVGATTTGDFGSPSDSTAPPPSRPLDYGSGGNNPCMATPSQEDKSCQVDGRMLEHGATFLSCSDACRATCAGNISITFGHYNPSDFPFVTTVQDDGQGSAGGWQVAKVNLEFKRVQVYELTYTAWYCDFNVEMPLRTQAMGTVDATRAATFSVDIADSVGRGMDFSLPQGIFCSQFVQKMRDAFKSKYPKLGATAVKK